MGHLYTLPSATKQFSTADSLCVDKILCASWPNGVISVQRVTHCLAGERAASNWITEKTGEYQRVDGVCGETLVRHADAKKPAIPPITLP